MKGAVLATFALLGISQFTEGFFFPPPKPPGNCRTVGWLFGARTVCDNNNNNNNNNNNDPSSGYCMCSGSGDPHYKTYDGATIHFMGICKYTLTQLINKNDKCYFNVEVKNERRGWNQAVAYTRLVDVKLKNTVIRLHQGRRVFVNKMERFLPVTLPNGVTIVRSGNLVVVKTDCDIQVTWDGNHAFTIKVPNKFGGNMNGICGDCNGKSDDFKTKDGQSVANNGGGYNLIGNSYNVPDDSDQPHTHCMKIPPFPTCTQSKMTMFQDDIKYCGLMKSKSHSFKDCINSNRVDWQGFLDSCKMDVCANYETEDRDKTICEALEGMAKACRDKGLPVNWRLPNFCPMVCGANEQYNHDAPGCEASCAKPNVGTCNMPTSEGCACKSSFLRSGDKCVAKNQCGCMDANGDYYPMGAEKRTTNCGELFQCVFQGGKSVLKKIRSGQSCHADASCSIRDGEHTCVCKSGFSGDGFTSCIDLSKRCTCSGSGDPHYHTFDGQMIHFQGICMYTLSQLINSKHPCAFKVKVKNERRGWNWNVAWTRMVDFEIYGQKVRIMSGRRVQINGATKYLPITLAGGKMRVFYNGNNVQVDTDCGITVTFDGGNKVIVNVPSIYGGQMNGICGDCNNRKDDYRTKEGEDVSRDGNAFNLIGLSYTVKDDSDQISKECTPPDVEPKDCSRDLYQSLGGDDMCGMIKDTAGPFRECILAQIVDVSQFFDNCRIDICEYEDDKTLTIDELVCDSLTSFAAICNNNGYEVFWRSEQFCPLPCGANEVYSTAANPCPETCNGQMTGSTCHGPRVEGCQCMPGFVMSDAKCVKKSSCGCKDNEGNYYPIGAEFRGDDCSTVFKCQKAGKGAVLKKEDSGLKCHKDATCGMKDGERACICKEGYAGDGVYSCINTNRCTCAVTGDPHYKTYDGQMIHYQGKCKYTLTQSTTKNDKCAFNVEVKNENRYRNNFVSWTRMVDFEIYGIRVRMLPGNKVEVDGEERFMPFTHNGGKLRVSLVAGKIQVDTDCGISVSFDGVQDVIVDVPGEYAGKMTGICGDCNGEKDDWRTKEGDDVTEYDESERYSDIGNSYQVNDDSDIAEDTCKTEPKIPPECSKSSYKKFADNTFCGYIKDLAGPFRECIESGLVEFEEFFENCRIDMCSYEKKGKLKPEHAACESLTAFAAVCNGAGFAPIWRERKFCPMKCPSTQQYSANVRACPETCGEPSPKEFCNQPAKEGCQCKKGLLLNDNKCTPPTKCGCTDKEGNYLPIGEKRISDDCTTTYECVWDKKNVKSFIDEKKNSEKCHMAGECKVTDGEKKCVCKDGYEGDGITKCDFIPPPTTTTTAEPTTAPPCEVIADIAMIMDSSSSIGKKNYETMKTFVKDVVTNFNIKPDKVRVAVQTYNTQSKIQFNFNTHGGEEDIPFAIDNIHEISKGTFTDRALKMAREQVFSTARPGVPKIAIVLTDGLSKQPKATAREAEALRQSGVTVFCIGIGDVSPKEVSNIASDPDDRFRFLVDSFDALETIKETVKKTACDVSEEEMKN